MNINCVQNKVFSWDMIKIRFAYIGKADQYEL